MEINGGLFEGKKWDELPLLYPDAYDLWANYHHKFEIEQGESMQQVFERMKNSILSIVNDNLHKTIAVISHGCAIRNFLCYANQLDFAELDNT